MSDANMFRVYHRKGATSVLCKEIESEMIVFRFEHNERLQPEEAKDIADGLCRRLNDAARLWLLTLMEYQVAVDAAFFKSELWLGTGKEGGFPGLDKVIAEGHDQ